jgi:Zn-dependent protease
METGMVCGRCEVAVCGRCVVSTVVGSRCRRCSELGAGPRVRADSVTVIRPAGTLSSINWNKVLVVAGVFLATLLVMQWLQGDHYGVIVKLIVYGGWLVSLSLHEFSHSVVGYIGGDRAIKRRGYLTLNPLRFIHPFFSLIMPMVLVLLGGMPLIGGATMVERHQLRGKWWDTAVSLVGPAANLAVAGVLALVLVTGDLDPESPVAAGLAFLALLQVSSFLFNLIPFPPLDGFGALAPHLPAGLAAQGRALGNAGLCLLFVIFWYVPTVSAGFWTRVYQLADALNIPADAIYNGYWAARFW